VEQRRFRNGEDLSYLPLIDRKLGLHGVVAKRRERLLYCDHLDADGEEALFQLAREQDEGVVAERKSDPYRLGHARWLRICNRDYSQWVGRAGNYSSGSGKQTVTKPWRRLMGWMRTEPPGVLSEELGHTEGWICGCLQATKATGMDADFLLIIFNSALRLSPRTDSAIVFIFASRSASCSSASMAVSTLPQLSAWNVYATRQSICSGPKEFACVGKLEADSLAIFDHDGKVLKQEKIDPKKWEGLKGFAKKCANDQCW
jgi:hypothetical protein